MKALAVLFLLSTFIFTSCSQESEKAPAVFKVSIGALSSGLSDLNTKGAGGLAIWGKNSSNGQSFGKVFLPPYTGDIEVEIDHGSWEFYAILWNGDEDLTPATMADNGRFFTGETRCENVSNIEISGTEARVALALDGSKCDNIKFSPTSYLNSNSPKSFRPAKLYSCVHLEEVSGGSDTCNDLDSLALSYKPVIVNYGLGGPSVQALGNHCYGYPSSSETHVMPTGVRFPFGEASSPFKLGFIGFNSHDCSLGGGDDEEPEKILFLSSNGLGQTIQNNDREVYAHDGFTKIFYAVNEFGAGYSPLYSRRAEYKCYNNSGVAVDCLPALDTQSGFIGSIYAGGGGEIRIRLKDILANDGDEANITTCTISNTNNLTNSTPMISIDSFGDKYCTFNLSVIGSPTHSSNMDSSSTSSTFNFTLEVNNGSSVTYQICDPYEGTNCSTGGTHNKAYNVYVKGQQYRDYEVSKNIINGLLGFESVDKNASDEYCFGTGCKKDGPSHTYSTLSEATELFLPDSLGGVLHKAGFQTCAQIKNATKPISFNVNSFNDNFQIKILAPQKERPVFMHDSGSGQKFDFRIELYENSKFRVALETDCTSATPQLYIKSAATHTDEADRVEKEKLELYLLGQSVGSPSEVEVELVLHRDDTEEGSSNQDKRYKNFKNIIKYHYFDNGSTDMQFKFWSSFSQKNIDWDPTNTNFNHRWVVGRVYGAKKIDNPQFQTIVNLMDNHATSGSTFDPDNFLAAYPENKSCDASTGPAMFNVDVPDLSSLTWSNSLAVSGTDCQNTSLVDSMIATSINLPSSFNDQTPMWGYERLNDSIGVSIMTGPYITNISLPSSQCSYYNNTGNNVLVSFQFDANTYYTSQLELKNQRIFSSQKCDEFAKYRYGSSYGYGSFSGGRLGWSNSADAASASNFMSKECFTLSSNNAKLAGSPGSDCFTTSPFISTAVKTSIPAALAGFQNADDFDFSIDYIGDDSNGKCSSSNCFEVELDMGL